MRKVLTLSLLVSTLLVAGWFVWKDVFETIDMPFASGDLSDSLPEALDHEGIWYERVGQKVFRVKKTDSEQVFLVAKELSSEFLLKDLSFSPTPEFWERIRPKLEQRQMSYVIRVVDGETWVVFAPEHIDEWQDVVFGQ